VDGRARHPLETHGVRGTFFARGAAVIDDPGAVATLASAGHVVGNHLWSHSDPRQQSRAELREEIERTATAIEEAGAGRPDLVRPPYCGAPHAVASAARGANVSAIVLRSVDPEDWSLDSADEIFDRVMAKIGPGDIVCLHDGLPERSSGTRSREHTVAAVERLVPALVERGLSPVTVPQLLA
jgi:peptidoglycan/xylan/chitin deacetylase (PgdA/CDA1 family)